MSDETPKVAESPPGPQEHRPNTLRDTERESYRELIAEIGHDKIWANRLRAVLDDSDYWIEEAARRGLEAKAAIDFVESQAVLAEKHDAERDAKISELESQLARCHESNETLRERDAEFNNQSGAVHRICDQAGIENITVDWGGSWAPTVRVRKLSEALKSQRARVAELELEVDALRTDRNEHVCPGPVVGNIVQSPAQRDRENELRAQLQEYHQMLQSHGATIQRQAETNEKLKAEAARDRRELVAALDGRQAAIERLDVARKALTDINLAVQKWSDGAVFVVNKVEDLAANGLMNSEPLKTEAGDSLLTVLSKVRSDCERAKADAARLQQELEKIRAAEAHRAQESACQAPDVVRLRDDLQASEAALTAAENLLDRLEVKIGHLVTIFAHLAHPEVRDEVDACLGLIGKHNERTVTE